MEWEKIKFFDFGDFYENKDAFKECYDKLPSKEKWMYKRYIYSDEILEKTRFKDVIWNYLNDDFGEEELDSTYKEFLNKEYYF